MLSKKHDTSHERQFIEKWLFNDMCMQSHVPV